MASQTTSRQYLFQLQLIYGAQAMAVLVFGVVAAFIGPSAQPEAVYSPTIMIYVLGGAVVVALSASHFVFNLMVGKIDRNLALKPKLQKYQSAVLIRSAILEFPGLFASVICILSGSLLPLIPVALILIVFYFLRPSVAGIVQDLGLPVGEKLILENPAGIIDGS